MLQGGDGPSGQDGKPAEPEAAAGAGVREVAAQVQRAQGMLQSGGVSTLYSKIFPAEVPDYLPNADLVAAKKPVSWYPHDP